MLAPAPEVPGAEFHLATLNQREAFLTLLAGTFNRKIIWMTRLRRQFETIQAHAKTVPVKKLSYPRSLDGLPAVLELVVSDLCTEKSEIACSA